MTLKQPVTEILLGPKTCQAICYGRQRRRCNDQGSPQTEPGRVACLPVLRRVEVLVRFLYESWLNVVLRCQPQGHFGEPCKFLLLIRHPTVC